MIQLLRIGVAGITLGLTALFGLLGWNLWTYHRLGAESWVADVAFQRIGTNRFIASLDTPDEEPRRFLLAGDDWQLDARMVTWAPWMQLLGRDPIYRLDRLSGRYQDVDQARREPPTVWGLSDNPGIDLWRLARKGGDWVPGIDAAYGAAVYLPMADGARYRVTLSARGLVARPYNDQAASAISTWY